MSEIIQELLEKYKEETITPAEWEQLREAMISGNYQDLIHQDIVLQLGENTQVADWKTADSDAILKAILSAGKNKETSKPVHRIHLLRTAWFRYAAVVVLLMAAWAYLWIHNTEKNPAPGKSSGISAAIKAGQQGAVLTLANGRTVLLDSLGNGIVADQNGVQVFLKNGQLVYDPAGASNGSMAYNTIVTPKGKQFNIVLPDGSKVYLNAASSMKYPIAFTGKERRIEVTGEAYFEVAKNSNLPFFVSVNQQMDVEVLGTSFNVNAYRNESSINTTLVEGLIRVVKGEKNSLVKPGEQARINNDISIIKNADVAKAVAWKNGLFNFEGVALREMMRQIERWYDIDVVYKDDVPDEKFFGKISRKVDLSTVLEALKGFGLQYEIKADKKIIVISKA